MLENLRLRYQKFALDNVSQSRTDTQAFKAVWKSSTLVKTIFTIKVSNNLKIAELNFPSKQITSDATKRKRAFILNT